MVGEHAGQSMGTRGSGMGQRGQCGQGDRWGWGAKRGSAGVMHCSNASLLACHGGGARKAQGQRGCGVGQRGQHRRTVATGGGGRADSRSRWVVGGQTAGAGGACRGGRAHRAGHGGMWQWHVAERERAVQTGGQRGLGAKRGSAVGRFHITVMRHFWCIVLEEHTGHRGSTAVVWGRKGSAGKRQQQEVAGGWTAGAGGWWEDRQQAQGEHVMVREHTGQGMGAHGSGMGQRERAVWAGGQRGLGAKRGSAAGMLCITVTCCFWRVMLEEHAGHGGSVVVAWGREGSAGEWQEWEGGGGVDSRSRRMASLEGGGGPRRGARRPHT